MNDIVVYTARNTDIPVSSYLMDEDNESNTPLHLAVLKRKTEVKTTLRTTTFFQSPVAQNLPLMVSLPSLTTMGSLILIGCCALFPR